MISPKSAVLTGFAALGAHLGAWALFDAYRYGLAFLFFPRVTVSWALSLLGKHEIEDIPEGGAAVSLAGGVLLIVIATTAMLILSGRRRKTETEE